MGDRLLGLAVGLVVGAAGAIAVAALLTFVIPAPLWLAHSTGQAVGLGLVIWGWYHGAYRLGQLVGWARRRLSPPPQ